MAYEYKVYEARITYANPTDHVYKALISEIGAIIPCVPVGVRRMRHGTVTTADCYTVGDLVFVLKNDTASNAAMGQTIGFILGIFPGDTKTYVDAELQGKPADDDWGAAFYKENKVAYGNPEEDKTFTDKHRGLISSGDLAIGGTDTLLHVTDRTVSVGSTDASIHTNSIDGSISTESIVYDNKTPGVRESVKIINDTVLKSTQVFGCLDASKQPKAGFVEHTGDLPYGNIRTIHDAQGQAISRVAQLNDGSIKIDAATGIRLTRSSNIKTQADQYTQLINYDESVLDKSPNDHPTPYDRVTDSDKWDGVSRTTDKSKKIPVQRPVVSDKRGVEIKDVTQQHSKYTVPSESGLYVLDDGSIVIRDAWGSEIRMVNGDIQISAANKIIKIADTDVLTLCGGVSATKADAGFQVKTVFGHIDIASGKEVNVMSNDRINVVGDKDINVEALEDILISTGSNYVANIGGVALFSVYSDFLVESTTYCVRADSDCTMATRSSMARITNGSVDIAAPMTIIHSDVELSGESYDAGNIFTGELSPIVGTGSLRVGGTITVDSGIVASGYIMATEPVYASQVCALSVADDVGVFKIKSLPKVKTEVSAHKSKSGFNKENVDNAQTKLEKTTAKELLKNAFSASFTDPRNQSNDIAIYLPGYVKSGESRQEMKSAEHHVAATKESMYIYPGKDFWDGESVYVPTSDDEINTQSETKKLSSVTTIVKEDTYYEQKR